MTLAVVRVRPQSDAPPTLSPGRRHRAARLLAELTARADDRSEVAVTVAELAVALCVADRTVQRASLDLVAAGLLEVVRLPAESPQRGVPNLYRIFPATGEPDEPSLLGLCHEVAPICNAPTAGGELR